MEMIGLNAPDQGKEREASVRGAQEHDRHGGRRELLRRGGGVFFGVDLGGVYYG
jgi:hypothetical protein